MKQIINIGIMMLLVSILILGISNAQATNNSFGKNISFNLSITTFEYGGYVNNTQSINGTLIIENKTYNLNKNIVTLKPSVSLFSTSAYDTLKIYLDNGEMFEMNNLQQMYSNQKIFTAIFTLSKNNHQILIGDVRFTRNEKVHMGKNLIMLKILTYKGKGQSKTTQQNNIRLRNENNRLVLIIIFLISAGLMVILSYYLTRRDE